MAKDKFFELKSEIIIGDIRKVHDDLYTKQLELIFDLLSENNNQISDTYIYNVEVLSEALTFINNDIDYIKGFVDYEVSPALQMELNRQLTILNKEAKKKNLTHFRLI